MCKAVSDYVPSSCWDQGHCGRTGFLGARRPGSAGFQPARGGGLVGVCAGKDARAPSRPCGRTTARRAWYVIRKRFPWMNGTRLRPAPRSGGRPKSSGLEPVSLGLRLRLPRSFGRHDVGQTFRPVAGHGYRSVLAFSLSGAPSGWSPRPSTLRALADPRRQGVKTQVPRVGSRIHAPAFVSGRITLSG